MVIIYIGEQMMSLIARIVGVNISQPVIIVVKHYIEMTQTMMIMVMHTVMIVMNVIM